MSRVGSNNEFDDIVNEVEISNEDDDIIKYETFKPPSIESDIEDDEDVQVDKS